MLTARVPWKIFALLVIDMQVLLSDLYVAFSSSGFLPFLASLKKCAERSAELQPNTFLY